MWSPDAGSGQPVADRDRAAAIFATQATWIVALTHERGGQVWQAGDVRAARWPDGGAVLLPDGSLPATDLDAVLAWFREEPPAEGILFWAMQDSDGAALAARGCEPSFRPHWMWRDLGSEVQDTEGATPGILVRPAGMSDRAALASADGLPYAHPEATSAILQMTAHPPAAPSAWLLIAETARGERWRPRRIVGQAALYLPQNAVPVAGLFDVGVVPGVRRQGVGAALVRVACALASSRGAIGIGLNATPEGERLYRRLGFVSAGHGQTWLLPAERLPATERRAPIVFAEAIAAGDSAVMRAHASDARTPLLNGDTPLAFAARFSQVASARWLLAHGASPEIVPLWALGLRAEALAAMADARLRDARSGPDRATPLHEAVRRNDPDLVRALVAAGADRSATDATWHATPAGWARALGHDHLLALLSS